MKQFPTAFSVLITIAALACLALIPSGCDFEKSRLERKVDAFLEANDYASAFTLVLNFRQQHPSEPVGRAMMVRVLAAFGFTDSAFTEYYRYYRLSKRISPQLLIEISRGALNHDDSSVRDAAAKSIAALDNDRNAKDLKDIANDGDGLRTAGDKRVVSAFIKALKDSDVSVRQTAVEVLGHFGDTRAVPPLIQTLNDSKSALEGLEDFHKGEPYPYIVMFLSIRDKKGISDLDYSLRLSAARALGKLGDIRAVPALIRVLNDRDALEHVAAAKALSELGDERGVFALTNALNDGDDVVRALAAEALVGVVDIGIVPTLISALKNSDDLARDYDDLVGHHLAEALVELGDRSVVPVLIEIIGGDDSIALKFWAAEALVKLSR